MTQLEYWTGVHQDAARWRTATRKTHWCSNQGRRYPCPHGDLEPAIGIGDRYFDTAEVVDFRRTAKLCVVCAHAILT